MRKYLNTVWRPKVQFQIYVISKMYYECYKRCFWLKIRIFSIQSEGQKYNFKYMLFSWRPRPDHHPRDKKSCMYGCLYHYPILMPHARLREHVVVPETVQCKKWFRHIMVNFGDCPQRTYDLTVMKKFSVSVSVI